MADILFFNESIDFQPKQKIALRNWLKKTAKEEGFKISELNYIFCSDEHVWEMNKQYLDHDTYTDILTFDNGEEEGVLLGDIFISVDRVRENAEKFKVSFEDELHRVMVHGVLHLCGYDDLDDQALKIMREKEDYYLALREEKLRVNIK